jgi:hypothetical protein
MPVEVEEDKKKPAQQQQQNLAMNTSKTPVLTSSEQAQLQQIRRENARIQSYNQDVSMKQQAKKAGENAFFSEFKRGVETAGLFIQKDNPSIQVPQVTEQTVKGLISGAQEDVMALSHGINAVASSRRLGIIGQGGERARAVRDDYERKLGSILGPAFASQVAELKGTQFNEKADQTIGPEVKAQIAQLNQSRADKMTEVVAWREGEIKKMDDWKTAQLARPRAEVELECLTKRVLDFYSLQGDSRANLEPAVKDIIKDARVNANQAFTSVQDNTYNQLKTDSASKSEG